MFNYIVCGKEKSGVLIFFAKLMNSRNVFWFVDKDKLVLTHLVFEFSSLIRSFIAQAWGVAVEVDDDEMVLFVYCYSMECQGCYRGCYKCCSS